MNNDVMSLISLCQKAGKLKSGDFGCLGAIKDSSARLTIISNEASQNTKKRFSDKSNFYKVPVVYIDCTLAELGERIGKGQRAVVTILDEKLAKGILEILDCGFKKE